MKQLFALLTVILAASFFTQVNAQTEDAPLPQYTGIIVMVDDLLGVFANNPTVNPMRQIRILNSAGAVVYQDGSTQPDSEQINLSAAPAGTYQIQIKLQVGWEVHALIIQ